MKKSPDDIAYDMSFLQLKGDMADLVRAVNKAVFAAAGSLGLEPSECERDDCLAVETSWVIPDTPDDQCFDLCVRLIDARVQEDMPERTMEMAIALSVRGDDGGELLQLVPGNLTEGLYTRDIETLRARVNELHGYIPQIAQTLSNAMEAVGQRDRDPRTPRP